MTGYEASDTWPLGSLKLEVNEVVRALEGDEVRLRSSNELRIESAHSVRAEGLSRALRGSIR